MNDVIFESFLSRQFAEGVALAAASDLVELHPLGSKPVQRYLARFRCRGLVRLGDRVIEHDCFDLGIYFPSDYLRRVNPLEILTLLGPVETWHPNCRAPGFCPGHLAPGMSLVELIHQCVEILSWRKVTMKEDDCMNGAACAWARANRSRFPVDLRPLRRRASEAIPADGTADGGASPGEPQETPSLTPDPDAPAGFGARP